MRESLACKGGQREARTQQAVKTGCRYEPGSDCSTRDRLGSHVSQAKLQQRVGNHAERYVEREWVKGNCRAGTGSCRKITRNM